MAMTSLLKNNSNSLSILQQISDEEVSVLVFFAAAFAKTLHKEGVSVGGLSGSFEDESEIKRVAEHLPISFLARPT